MPLAAAACGRPKGRDRLWLLDREWPHYLQLSRGHCNPPGAPRAQLIFPLPPSSFIPGSFCPHSAFTLGLWCNKEALPQNLQEQFWKRSIHKGIWSLSTRSKMLIHWKPNSLPSSNKTRTDVLLCTSAPAKRNVIIVRVNTLITPVTRFPPCVCWNC